MTPPQSDRPPPAASTRVLTLVGATTAAAVALGASWRRFGLDSRRFAFVVVWAPMAWLGTISRVVTPRLPPRYHELRDFERGGARLYELAGVRLAKALLRRGPIARFNPDLHLPAERTPERMAHLEQRMRDAEASHAILFAATLGGAAVVGVRGHRATARRMLLWNVVMNGYPVMLQRYNRGRLALTAAATSARTGPDVDGSRHPRPSPA